MKRLLLVSASLLLIGAVFLGCSKEEEQPQNYFPLAVGNTWNFQVHEWGANSPDTTYTEIQTLDHLANRDGYSWYAMFLPQADSTIDSIYYRKDEFFLYVGYFQMGEFLPMPISPLQPQAGYTWSHADSIGMLLKIYLDGIVQGAERITVPAGTFDCMVELVHIEIRGLAPDTVWLKYWLADDIGPARILEMSNTDTTDRQLSSYSLF